MRQVFKITWTILLVVGISIFAFAGTPDKNAMSSGMMNQTNMMQHGHMMKGHKGMMMGMQQMGGQMDSTMSMCPMMMKHMQQMGPQMMTGGQTGMNSMMGMAQNMKGMAENMKHMTQNMETMMNNKDVMGNKEFSDQMNKMYDMMSQTTQNMHTMSGMAENMFNQMHKQKTQK